MTGLEAVVLVAIVVGLGFGFYVRQVELAAIRRDTTLVQQARQALQQTDAMFRVLSTAAEDNSKRIDQVLGWVAEENKFRWRLADRLARLGIDLDEPINEGPSGAMPPPDATTDDRVQGRVDTPAADPPAASVDWFRTQVQEQRSAEKE